MSSNHHHRNREPEPEPLDSKGPFESTQKTDHTIVIGIIIAITILTLIGFLGFKWLFNTVKEEATQTLEQVQAQFEPVNKLITELKKNTQKIEEYRDKYQALINEVKAIPTNDSDARIKKAQLLKELKAIFENGAEI